MENVNDVLAYIYKVLNLPDTEKNLSLKKAALETLAKLANAESTERNKTASVQSSALDRQSKQQQLEKQLEIENLRAKTAASREAANEANNKTREKLEQMKIDAAKSKRDFSAGKMQDDRAHEIELENLKTDRAQKIADYRKDLAAYERETGQINNQARKDLKEMERQYELEDRAYKEQKEKEAKAEQAAFDKKAESVEKANAQERLGSLRAGTAVGLIGSLLGNIAEGYAQRLTDKANAAAKRDEAYAAILNAISSKTPGWSQIQETLHGASPTAQAASAMAAVRQGDADIKRADAAIEANTYNKIGSSIKDAADIAKSYSIMKMGGTGSMFHGLGSLINATRGR